MKICTDSCFLIALYDERESKHPEALAFFVENIERGPHQLLVPWPVMYESISTQMARVRKRMYQINVHLKSMRLNGKLRLVDDAGFREKAITKCFKDVQTRAFRPISLVDLVIREMLEDKVLRADALLTYNGSDFQDVLRRLGKRLYPQSL